MQEKFEKCVADILKRYCVAAPGALFIPVRLFIRPRKTTLVFVLSYFKRCKQLTLSVNPRNW